LRARGGTILNCNSDLSSLNRQIMRPLRTGCQIRNLSHVHECMSQGMGAWYTDKLQ